MKHSQKWNKEKLDNPGFTKEYRNKRAYRNVARKKGTRGGEKWRKYDKIPGRNTETFLYINQECERNLNVLYVNRQKLSEKKKLMDRQKEYLVMWAIKHGWIWKKLIAMV
jgi:hypothetical protein